MFRKKICLFQTNPIHWKFWMPMSFFRWGRGWVLSLQSNIPYLPQNVPGLLWRWSCWRCFHQIGLGDVFFCGASSSAMAAWLAELGTNLQVTSPGYSPKHSWSGMAQHFYKKGWSSEEKDDGTNEIMSNVIYIYMNMLWYCVYMIQKSYMY